jgi:hypothetical protein
MNHEHERSRRAPASPVPLATGHWATGHRQDKRGCFGEKLVGACFEAAFQLHQQAVLVLNVICILDLHLPIATFGMVSIACELLLVA